MEGSQSAADPKSRDMVVEEAFPSVRQRAGLRRRVLSWYEKFGRHLPWRESSDAYSVWISEIMLQQTTVATVLPYFDRFLSSMPSVEALAEADEAEVLKLWEGLGYYSRARNIHKTARIVADELSGSLPQDVDELRKLPGIGRYTAGAIASFAYGRHASILEANTIRLYARVLGLELAPSSSAGQKQLWAFADWLTPAKDVGAFNQAVMDIGSGVCRPVEPVCGECPLNSVCKAFESGRQHEIPRKKERQKPTAVCEVSIAVRKNDRILMRQRTSDERWAGLWEFVRVEVPPDVWRLLPPVPTLKSARGQVVSPGLFDGLPEECSGVPLVLCDQVAAECGVEIRDWVPVMQCVHLVTRYRIELACFEAQADGGRIQRKSGYTWRPFSALKDLPLSRTARDFATCLQAR